MANVLTDLAGDIYVAADTVSRELVGMIPSVTLNAGTDRVALNGVVRSHVTNAATSVNNTPSMTIPEGTDQTVGNTTMTIDKSKSVQIPWTGEDIMSVDNGAGFSTIYGDQIAQAMRTLTNEMELDLATAGYLGASRAYGTAGSTPFGTAGDFTDAANLAKIIEDNGGTMNGASLVMNTTAGVNLVGKQSRVDIAGQETMLRQGVLLDTAGFMLRKSGQIQTPAAGAMANATTNAAGYAIGATAITLATAGTGVVAAGDIITFAGDTNKYVISSVVFAGANPAAGDVITLAENGLRIAIVGATNITVVAAAARNLGFTRSSIELAIRPPALPQGGDIARDRMLVTDPHSGLVFDIAYYVGFQKAMINVGAAWGKKVWKPEHVATLLG